LGKGIKKVKNSEREGEGREGKGREGKGKEVVNQK